jgi:hypothetical protein
MKRRDFVIGLLLTATTASTQAQQKAKVHRLAVVDPINPVGDISEAGDLPYYRGFFQRFQHWDLPRDEISRSSDIPLKGTQNALSI